MKRSELQLKVGDKVTFRNTSHTAYEGDAGAEYTQEIVGSFEHGVVRTGSWYVEKDGLVIGDGEIARIIAVNGEAVEEDDDQSR